MSDAPLCPTCSQPIPADAPNGLCPSCLLAAGQRSTAPLPGAPRGGMVAPAPAELAPDFPLLEIGEVLGQGGMGAVYRARQRHLDRPVALKILRPELGEDPAFAERFGREARALARLSHPHLVTVHDFGQNGRWLWIIMELVDGANLRALLQDGRLTQRQALEIVPQLCEALQYAHDHGVVHRDIKPENILLSAEGQVKIADFGLAKLLRPEDQERGLTASRDMVGTAHYMAPEQIECSRDVDHRADIYSLGVVFYEMLTGGLPLGRFEVPSKSTAGDPKLDDVVMRTLAKDPGQRYQQASEVKCALQGAERAAPLPPAAAPGRPATAAAAPLDHDGPLLVLIGAFVAVASLVSIIGDSSQARPIDDDAWMMILIGAGVAWSGVQALRSLADRRWVRPGKMLCLVAIPLAASTRQTGLFIALSAVIVYWIVEHLRRTAVPPPTTLAMIANGPWVRRFRWLQRGLLVATIFLFCLHPVPTLDHWLWSLIVLTGLVTILLPQPQVANRTALAHLLSRGLRVTGVVLFSLALIAMLLAKSGWFHRPHLGITTAPGAAVPPGPTAPGPGSASTSSF